MSAHQLVLASDPNAAVSTGIAAKSLAPVSGPFVQKLVLVLERPANSTGPYDVRLVDPDNPAQALTDTYRLTFPEGQTRASAELTVKPPAKVHKYPYLKVETRRPTGAAWVAAKLNQTSHPVYYTPFGLPKEPFQNGEILSQAALDLAWEIERDAETQEGARRRAAARIGPWLKENHFTYNPAVSHTGIDPAGQYLSRQKFNFRKFIRPTTAPSVGGRFEGDCQDVASLEVMCAAAVGVDHTFFYFRPGPPRPNQPALGHMDTKLLWVQAAFVSKSDGSGPEPDPGFRSYTFGVHEIPYWQGKSWDGLTFFEGTGGQPLPGWDLAIDDFLDRFLSGQQWERQNDDKIKTFAIPPGHSWVTFKPKDYAPMPDPRTPGVDPIQLTVIDQ